MAISSGDTDDPRMNGSGGPSRRLNSVLMRPQRGETREEFKARLAAALLGQGDTEDGSTPPGVSGDSVSPVVEGALGLGME